MKQYIFPAIKITLLCLIFFSGLYTLLIWLFAQASPNKGLGETQSQKNKIIGYTLLGQNFTQDNYFWGRPSAVGYNAMGSGGSNKGSSNPDYLKDVKNRIDSFLLHNPSIKKEEIPSELVTASGSGLDPDLSPNAAYVQVERIAKARNLNADKIKTIVTNHIDKPLFGILGPEKVNVLQLNMALNQLH
jgi:potassium-transporting ATPase KdpC subunit